MHIFQKAIMQEEYKMTFTAPVRECPDKLHIITLTQEYHFHSLKRDFSTLYQNFCPISYLSNRLPTIVKQRKTIGRLGPQKSEEIEVTFFSIMHGCLKDQSFFLYQMERCAYNQNLRRIQSQSQTQQDNQKVHITYLFSRDEIKNMDDWPNKAENLIQVNFQSETKNKKQLLHIKIIDQDQIFMNLCRKNCTDVNTDLFNRISILNHKQNKNQLEYYWLESNHTWNKIIPGKHIVVALQGGGVKGICYIGVQKALKKACSTIPITSVIGSSAGGILGLGICCGLKEEQIIDLCINDLSQITKRDRKYNPNLHNSTYEKYYLSLLKEFFVEYGILEADLMKIIEKILEEKEIFTAIIELVEAINPAFKDLLSTLDGKGGKKFFLYGLLMGKLMNGNSVLSIAKKCLLIFKKSKGIIATQGMSDQEWAQKLTMSQFYELTQIQFTCTSVDLNNHILRFFNQKTTPDLPVCYAVQMTGSFPVAFEAQKWRGKEWGKYYIHYQNTRKEIDLDGCQFTDGGMLANFPIKYLDNQKMRPMYFSHATRYKKCSEQKYVEDSETLLFGFGLNDIKKNSPSTAEKIAQKQEKLLQVIFNSIGMGQKLKIATNFLWKALTPSPTVKINLNQKSDKMQKIREIPLFEFLSKLIKTYQKTKDNLTKQCLKHDICCISVNEEIIAQQQGSKVHSQFEEGINNFFRGFTKNVMNNINTLRQTNNKFQDQTETMYDFTKNPQDYIEIFFNNLQFIYNFMDKHPYCYTEPQVLRIELTLNHLISTFLNFSDKARKGYTFTTQQTFDYIKFDTFHKMLKKSVKELLNMRYSTLFVHESTVSDVKYLKKLVTDLLFEGFQHFLSKKKDSTFTLVNRIFQDIHDYELQKYENLNGELLSFSIFLKYGLKKKENKKSLKSVKSSQSLLKSQNQYSQYVQQNKHVYMSEDLLFNLFQIRKNFLTTSSLPNLIKYIDETISKSRLTQLMISYDNYEKKREIKVIIRRMIEKQYYDMEGKSKGIHLILQSTKLSEIYFHYLIGVVKIVIMEFNSELRMKKKKDEEMKRARDYFKFYGTDGKGTGRDFMNIFPVNFDEQKKNRDADGEENSKKGTSEIKQDIDIINWDDKDEILEEENQEKLVKKTLETIPLALQKRQTTALSKAIQRQEQIFIQSMTSQEYHSVVMFLHASDFSTSKIESQIWRIRNLIKMNLKSSSTYDSKKWYQVNKIQMKELQEEIWKNRFNIYKELEMSLNTQKFRNQNDLRKYVKEKMRMARDSIDEINEVMESSLNFLIDEIGAMDLKREIPDIVKELEDRLGLASQVSVRKKILDNAKKSGEFFDFFIDKYLDLFKYLLYFLHKNVVFHLNFQEKKQAWKGLLIAEALTGIRLKTYVCEKLQEMGLKVNTTMKQFYELSTKKIHLNFLAIESESNSIIFINHKTSPYMPVWAAIMATSSGPMFFKPLQGRSEWDYKPTSRLDERITRQYFSNPHSSSKNFQSASFLLKLPLQLVTNHRIKEIITEHHEQIYIPFTFSVRTLNTGQDSFISNPQNRRQGLVNYISQDQRNQILSSGGPGGDFFSQIMKEIVCKPLTTYDVLYKVRGFPKEVFALAMSIPAITRRLNFWGLYVNSHDNLIMRIYEKELTRLPVRLDTLDFYHLFEYEKDEKEESEGGKSDKKEQNKVKRLSATRKRVPSKIFLDTIMQSYYISLESIHNSRNNILNQRSFYIRIESSQDAKRLSSSLFSIRFLSYFEISRSLMERFKIHYKLSRIYSEKETETNEFTEINHEFLRMGFPESEDDESNEGGPSAYDQGLRNVGRYLESEHYLFLKVIYPEIVLTQQELEDSAVMSGGNFKQMEKKIELHASNTKNIKKTQKTFKIALGNLVLNKLKLHQISTMEKSWKERREAQGEKDTFSFIYRVFFNKFTEKTLIIPQEGAINEKSIPASELDGYGIQIVSADTNEIKVMHLEADEREEMIKSCPECCRLLLPNLDKIQQQTLSNFEDHGKQTSFFGQKQPLPSSIARGPSSLSTSTYRDQKIDKTICSSCLESKRHLIYKCQCHRRYCTKCKYKLQLNEVTFQLMCPLNHILCRESFLDEGGNALRKHSHSHEDEGDKGSVQSEGSYLTVKREGRERRELKINDAKSEDQGLAVGRGKEPKDSYGRQKTLDLGSDVQNIRFEVRNLGKRQCDICECISSDEFFVDPQCKMRVCQVCTMKVYLSNN